MATHKVHKVVGKMKNGTVQLFNQAHECNRLGVGDIVEIDGEFVRMYEDGQKGLRIWFVTELVLEAQVKRYMPAVREQALAHMNRWAVQAVAA